MTRRNRRPKPTGDAPEAVELPDRYFIELVDQAGKVLSSEGRPIERKGRSAYNRAAVIFENGGYAEDVVAVRLTDRDTGLTLYHT